MASRFKMRISRVITSFKSCRSKDATALPANPVFRLSPVNPNAVDIDFPATPPGNSHAPADADDLTPTRETPAYLWREEGKWHVVARIGPSSSPRRKIDSDDGELFPPLPIRRPVYRKSGKRSKKKKTPASLSKARVSTSSADTLLFTSEDEYEDDYYDYDDDESETLMSSSRSLSTESSAEFNPRLKPIRESSSAAVDGGKVSESFAVVKRSEDPYGDFRRSMVEMIVEKKMYEEGDLEQLLHCFLSLNSRHHHPAIVQAFSEIWDALFSAASSFPPASANLRK